MVFESIGMQEILIFGLFLVCVVIFYKFVKMLFGALIAGIAGFLFPWILNYAANYYPMPFSITPSIQASIAFAVAAVVLYLAYKFFRYILAFLKLITVPFRAVLGKRK